MNNFAVSPERKKTFLFSGIANYGTIVVSVVAGLIAIPIGLNYFGPVLYGIWFVIISILAYLRIFDFGIGLSTLTLMAQTSDHARQRIILRRSIKLLLGISAIFIGIVLVINHLFPEWVGILGRVPLVFQGEAATALLAIVIIVLFQLPTTVFSAAFSGLQKVYWNRIYGALHSIAALGALVTTILTGGNLLTLAIFTGLGGLLVGIISGVHLFFAHPQIRPRLREKGTEGPSTNFLFSSGIRFLMLQIAVLTIWNTDNLVISHFLGPEKITPYAITFKLFQMGLMMITASIIALWPMYGQALSRGDWDWIRRTYNNSTILQVIGGGLILIGGILFSQLIINLWAGPAAYGGLAVALALGGYVYISSFGGSNASLINGLNPTNIVVVSGLTEAALNLGISLALIGPLGIGGVALGTFIASLVINTWFGPLYIQYRTQRKVTLEKKPILSHAPIVVFCVILALIVVLYLPAGLMKVVIGIAIICLYLVLSWQIIPQNLRDLIKNTIAGLRNNIKI